MHAFQLDDDSHLHWRQDGDPNGPPVVFANSLGTDLRLWDPILPYLPKTMRLIRYDKRGHGLSSVSRPPYKMGRLISDVEALLDHLEIKECVFVGLSIGGMIAQGLATKRLDLIRAVVLSNTAPKIGTRELWADRIAAVENGGTEGMAEAIMERWFSKNFRAGPDLRIWRQMVEQTSDDGYAGCCAAIAATDFYEQTASLRLPAMVIAGSEDGSTPPDLVRELAGLIPDADFQLIRGAGHLPCVEAPEAYAALLTQFFSRLGLNSG